MRHAIMAVDPGQTTGVAVGIVSSKGADPIKRFSSWELPAGDNREGEGFAPKYERAAMRLYQQWVRFRYAAYHHYGVSPLNHVLTMEDFIVSPNSVLKRDSLAPVYVSFLFEGIRHGMQFDWERLGFGPAHHPPILWSSPSNKKQANNVRLRTSGFWIRGSEHRRDAARHFLLRVMILGYTGAFARREHPPEPFYRAIEGQKPS